MHAEEKSPPAVRIGSPRVWDSHVHCYPADVIADPQAWARARGEAHWAHLVSAGPQGWADPDDLLRTMDREGVEKVLLQAWYWENPDTIRLQNQWHAGWRAAHPDRFLACAGIHPEMDQPVAELERAAEWGACAVGECLPQVQTSDGWTHPAWEAILHWTTAQQWPLFLHLTEPVGHLYPGRVETSLLETVQLFETYPDQKWVCAHWGGGLPFYTLNRRVGRAMRNVWVDTAASPLLYGPRVWSVVAGLLGADRLLFGSDFPLRLYPRLDSDPGWRRLLREVEASGLSTDEQERLYRENLTALLPPGAPGRA